MSNLMKLLAISALPLGLALLPMAASADEASEISTAATHADLAAHSTSVDMVHTHLHHTLNCLSGPAGADYDAKEINPCKNNGDGAIYDTNDAAKKKSLEAAADKAREGVKETNLTAAQKDASDAAAMLKAIK